MSNPRIAALIGAAVGPLLALPLAIWWLWPHTSLAALTAITLLAVIAAVAGVAIALGVSRRTERTSR